VPFSDDASLVASFLHEVRQGESVLVDDEVSIRWGDAGSWFAEGIFASEEGVSGGGAGGG